MSGGSQRDSTAVSPLLSSERVIEAIAAAKGVDPTDLDPLCRYLDLEALDSLVESATPDLSISWRIDGAEVEVSGDGSVYVH